MLSQTKSLLLWLVAKGHTKPTGPLGFAPQFWGDHLKPKHVTATPTHGDSIAWRCRRGNTCHVGSTLLFPPPHDSWTRWHRNLVIEYSGPELLNQESMGDKNGGYPSWEYGCTSRKYVWTTLTLVMVRMYLDKRRKWTKLLTLSWESRMWWAEGQPICFWSPS